MPNATTSVLPKPLLIVHSDGQAESFVQRLDAAAKQTSEQVDFLRLRAEQALKAGIDARNAIWDEFTEYMQQKGIIPDFYNKSRHHFVIRSGVVHLVDTEQEKQCDAGTAIASLLRALTNNQ